MLVMESWRFMDWAAIQLEFVHEEVHLKEIC